MKSGQLGQTVDKRPDCRVGDQQLGPEAEDWQGRLRRRVQGAVGSPRGCHQTNPTGYWCKGRDI